MSNFWGSVQNTMDMMRALRDMLTEGEKVRTEDIEFVSPYATHNIHRFGRYRLHWNVRPKAGSTMPCLAGRPGLTTK
ncbi:hypothetical protein OKW48_001726 [Paraburkholderia youngii]